MKTIAIFSGYALPHLGGIERYINNLTSELLESGYKVILISTNYDGSFKTIVKNKNFIDIRIPIYDLFKKRYPFPKFNEEMKLVYKELDNNKIDRIIVNTRFHLTSLFGAKYGKKKNIPVYLIEHGSNHLSVNNKILDFFGAIYEHLLTNYLKRYVDYYYGVSKDACDWQKHFKIESDGIWYNSINRFDNNIKIRKSNKKLTVLYAGRILKQKGIEDLILAFNSIKTNKNIELIIAGDGDFLPYLKEKYSSNNIKFLGRVNFEELVKLYAVANIFVHPSRYPEGLPTCILEAGLMKCSIIATPNGGTRYFIDKSNGIIIETQDELKKALKKCINDDKFRNEISKNIYDTIIEKFTWEETTKKILKDMGI